MRLRLRVFGVTVVSLTCDGPQQFDEPEGITGGSGLYTERDTNPPNPSGEEPWMDRFGFG